jgi:tripartite-type tricarboxylate transporter receptor subunit TctC
MEARPMAPDALEAQIKTDVAQWSELVKRAGIKQR